MTEKLLEIENLEVIYETDDATTYAVNGVNLSIKRGETHGLVGETGAGKTTIAKSILKLLPEKIGFITNGKIMLNGFDVAKASEREMRSIRGEAVSMIFQDPMTSLNPTMTVGRQVEEAVVSHHKNINKEDLPQRVDEILEMVGIPCSRKDEYPHQFSGGMKQRIVIAMALSCQPNLLLADEPTTALDVTIQLQILKLIRNLTTEFGTSMLLITHDLGIVADICDTVSIMYAGHIFETGTVEDIFLGESHHPYTKGLFGAIPDITQDTRRLNPIEGLMPDPTNLPTGCTFHTRCKYCMDICIEMDPDAVYLNDTHLVRCHLFGRENIG